MKADAATLRKIGRDGSISALFYLAPVLLMFLWMLASGRRPWVDHPTETQSAWNLLSALHLPPATLHFISAHWLTLFVIALAIIEITLGLYGEHWNNNEKTIDIVAFILIQAVIIPVATLATFKLCAWAALSWRNSLGWVPFWWAVLMLAVADDLTQYWYHRLHHQLPWMWRFHRTHHSGRYMGAGIAYRQNVAYAIGFSNVYLIAALTFLGLGPAAILVSSAKSLIVVLSHSAILWDKPLYRFRILHPVTWLVERTIVLPATHHAHHACRNDDGIGYYKGNFGNMFFWWDLAFGTAHITRQYPPHYGVSHYEDDPWLAQMLWPLIKSNVAGSELAAGGPIIREDIALAESGTEPSAKPIEHRISTEEQSHEACGE